MKELNLDYALKVIDKARKKAEEIEVPMVITVVDAAGHLIACHRMDQTILASTDISQNKAWTAAALKMPTSQLAELAQPGKDLFGIHTTNGGRIVVFGGGIPIKNGEQIIGAIGVSGGSVSEDMQVAEAGLS